MLKCVTNHCSYYLGLWINVADVQQLVTVVFGYKHEHPEQQFLSASLFVHDRSVRFGTVGVRFSVSMTFWRWFWQQQTQLAWYGQFIWNWINFGGKNSEGRVSMASEAITRGVTYFQPWRPSWQLWKKGDAWVYFKHRQSISNGLYAILSGDAI